MVFYISLAIAFIIGVIVGPTIHEVVFDTIDVVVRFFKAAVTVLACSLLATVLITVCMYFNVL